MIQCRLRELIGAKARQEHRRITYDDILNQVGVNKTTLTKLANDRASMVGISVIDRLCTYFQCQPGDLFIHIEDPEKSESPTAKASTNN